MTALPAPMTLSAPGGTGEVHVQGAHLTSWTPTGHAPVLWTSTRARFEEGVAIRGGVPLVFPWFGSGPDGGLTPAHGFARLTSWRHLGTRVEGEDAVTAFELDSGIATAPAFPFRYSGRYEIRLGRALHLSLMVRNDDHRAFAFEEALHTYLTVTDVRSVRVQGLSGADYLDQVSAGGPTWQRQTGDVTFTSETDRIYSSTGPVRVVDEAGGRVLAVAKQDSASTVVWNPWADKARAMSDFGDDEWPSMVCIEGGNLRAHAVTLAPGESHVMGYSITVEELS